MLTRRQMLLASLGVIASGCSTPGLTARRRPGPVWPNSVSSPNSRQGIAYQPPKAQVRVPAANDPIQAIPRSSWSRRNPVKSRLNPMKGIQRITVHHEGSTTFWSADQNTTAARLEKVRAFHVGQRRFGDIGYHYIIDRAGRVWEGRSIKYQGAHVRNHNEHNLGVMVLGNFEKQRPTDAQLAALQRTVQALSKQYRVAKSKIYTHRELGPTTCPGRNLQPRVASLRAAGRLASL